MELVRTATIHERSIKFSLRRLSGPAQRLYRDLAKLGGDCDLQIRTALILNTYFISTDSSRPNFLNLPNINISEFKSAIAEQKAKLIKELPGFELANAFIEQGINDIFSELTHEATEENWPQIQDRFRTELMFIRDKFLLKLRNYLKRM